MRKNILRIAEESHQVCSVPATLRHARGEPAYKSKLPERLRRMDHCRHHPMIAVKDSDWVCIIYTNHQNGAELGIFCVEAAGDRIDFRNKLRVK
jgi:hypothetical protein